MTESSLAPFIFISYARSDQAFVKRMVADLEKQGIRAWVDQEGLVPGTADWEEEVRRAIRSSRAVLFMASPGARSSLYVRDELDIARHHQRPVFPIWIVGEEWIEAVPLGWGRMQYIDARGTRYETALAQLMQVLSTPPSHHMLNEISEDKEPSSLQAFLATQVKQTPQTIARASDEMPSTDLREIQQREKTAQEIYHRLTQPGVTAMVLTGIGGIGKSTLVALVREYGERQRRAGRGPFLAESIWLKVDSATTMHTIAERIFDALGESLPDIKTPQEQALMLFNALNASKQPRLVVLDQFENLLDWKTGDALLSRPGVGEWIDLCNNQPCSCRILLTSRPLPRGTRKSPPKYMQEYAVQGLETIEGVELLRKQGVLVQQATDDELQKAVNTAKGHPLALTLLASILRRNRSLKVANFFTDSIYAQLWVEDIADRLMDYIYKEQLDEVQRKLLRAFSLYRESVPLEAAMVFLSTVSGKRVLQALDVLLVQHLLQAVGEGRYQLHVIISSYAQKQLNKKALRDAHKKAAIYYLDNAARNYPSRERRARTSDVQPFVEAVWQFCQAEQWSAAYDLMEQEDLFSDLHRWGEDAALLELYQLQLPSLKKWTQDQPLNAIRFYDHLGETYEGLGQLLQGQDYCKLMLQLCRETNDRKEEGRALFRLATIWDSLGGKEQARNYYEQALQIYDERGEQRDKARSLLSLGWVYLYQGKVEQARECEEQSLQISKEIGDRWSEGWALSKLGSIHRHLGNIEQALECFKQALQIFQILGDRVGEAWKLTSLGELYNDLNRKELARQYLKQALNIFDEIGNRRGKAWILTSLGEAYNDPEQKEQAQAYMRQALKYLEQALTIFREVSDPIGEGITFKNFGQVYFSLGEEQQALKSYGYALSKLREVSDHLAEGSTLLNIGLLYFKQQRYDVALACFLLAKKCFERVESPEFRKAEIQIDSLHEQVGEQQFAELLAKIETQELHIVELALNRDIAIN